MVRVRLPMLTATRRVGRNGLRSRRISTTPPQACGFSTATRMASPMIRANPLKQAFSRLRESGSAPQPPSLGLWQMLPGANVSRALARTPDIDWVLVDCEHGQIDDAAMHEAVPVIAAEGVSPIVRLPDFQSWMVKRALDSGAHGILAPLIQSVAQVHSLISACKFPPLGHRGYGSPLAMQGFRTMEAHNHGSKARLPTFTEYLDQANDSVLVLVQIETREALDCVEDIAPLVDALFVGPFDLANNIGCPIRGGGAFPREVQDAMARILKASQAAGTCCGVYAATPEQALEYAGAGYHMMNVATDVVALGAAAAKAVAIARS